MKQRLLNISKILLVVLFVSYYGGTTLFLHTHQSQFGQVTHSHPFKNTHQHTYTEYETIHQLSNIILVVFSLFALFHAALLIQTLYLIKRGITPQFVYSSNPLRAPPVIA